MGANISMSVYLGSISGPLKTYLHVSQEVWPGWTDVTPGGQSWQVSFPCLSL